MLVKNHYVRQGHKDCPTSWEKEKRKLPSHFPPLFCLAYLSASSKISTSTLLRWKEGQLWRWSISRPGVAIRMSGPERRAASWVFTSRPPEREQTDCWVCEQDLHSSSSQIPWEMGKKHRFITHSQLEVPSPFLFMENNKTNNQKTCIALESEILNSSTPSRSTFATTTVSSFRAQHFQFDTAVCSDLCNSRMQLHTHLQQGKLWHCWTAPAVLWQNAPEYPVLVLAQEPVPSLLGPDEVCKSGAQAQARWKQLFCLQKKN